MELVSFPVQFERSIHIQVSILIDGKQIIWRFFDEDSLERIAETIGSDDRFCGGFDTRLRLELNQVHHHEYSKKLISLLAHYTKYKKHIVKNKTPQGLVRKKSAVLPLETIPIAATPLHRPRWKPHDTLEQKPKPPFKADPLKQPGPVIEDIPRPTWSPRGLGRPRWQPFSGSTLPPTSTSGNSHQPISLHCRTSTLLPNPFQRPAQDCNNSSTYSFSNKARRRKRSSTTAAATTQKKKKDKLIIPPTSF